MSALPSLEPVLLPQSGSPSASRFFTRLVLVLLPVLVALSWLEWQMARMPTMYGSKKVLLEQALGRIEALVLGNSHPYFGIDPTALRWWGFNLALPGQPMRIDRALLQNYMQRMPRLKLVIVGASYHSYGYDLVDTLESWRLMFYDRIHGIPAPDPAWSPSRFSWIAMYGDPHRAAATWLEGYLDPGGLASFDAQGKVLTQPRHPNPIAPEEARKVANYLDGVYKDAHVAENEAGFRQLFATLKRRGVAVALVTLPTERTYAAAVQPARLAAVRTLSAKLARETGAHYFDYFQAPGFDTADFLDVDHVAPGGAAKVARLLDRDLARALPAYAASAGGPR